MFAFLSSILKKNKFQVLNAPVNEIPHNPGIINFVKVSFGPSKGRLFILWTYLSKVKPNWVLYYKTKQGREPRLSDYGRRLMFRSSWVWIPAPYAGWTFFTFNCCENCKVCLKKTKINEKEAGDGRFFRKRPNQNLQWKLTPTWSCTSFRWLFSKMFLPKLNALLTNLSVAI